VPQNAGKFCGGGIRGQAPIEMIGRPIGRPTGVDDRLVDRHNIIDSASPEQAFVGEIRIHGDGRNARLRAERGGRGAGGRPPTAAMGADAYAHMTTAFSWRRDPEVALRTHPEP